MEYYSILDSCPSDDIKEIKKRFIEKIKNCHPDKMSGNDEIAKKLIEAWNYIYENHKTHYDKRKQVSSDLIPPGFKRRGYNYIPTVGEFVRKEIEREKKTKLENKKTLILEDKEEESLLVKLYNYFFE